MANATISQIKVGNTTYDICDAISRDDITTLQSNVSTLQSNTSDIATIRSNASTGKSQSDTNKAALANIGTAGSIWGKDKVIPYKKWTWGNADLSVPVGTHLLISNTTASTWTSTADNNYQTNYKNKMIEKLLALASSPSNSKATAAGDAISYFAFSGHGIFATWIGKKTGTPGFERDGVTYGTIPHCVAETLPSVGLRGLKIETVSGSATTFGVAIYQGAFTSGANFGASLRYIRIK